MTKTQVHLFFDGACDNNSKMRLMGAGVAVYCEGEYSKKYSKAFFAGTNGTSNIAEWEALTMALKIACTIQKESEDELEFHIFGDSQVVVNQINEDYKIKQEHFLPYFKQSNIYKQYLGSSLHSISWIRRTFNTKADELSKEGLTVIFK